MKRVTGPKAFQSPKQSDMLASDHTGEWMNNEGKQTLLVGSLSCVQTAFRGLPIWEEHSLHADGSIGGVLNGGQKL
jgi:hypothetical protein